MQLEHVTEYDSEYSDVPALALLFPRLIEMEFLLKYMYQHNFKQTGDKKK